MDYVGDDEYDGKARGPWSKFLGRFFVALLNEIHAKEVLLKRVVEAGERIQGTAFERNAEGLDLGRVCDEHDQLDADGA